jgi:ribose transport system ATP-binding protein
MLVRMDKINKDFLGNRALSDVSFELKRGEVHVLIGENGAGKSTLMKILGGQYAPDAGKVFIEGSEFKDFTPYDAKRRGVAMIYQELNLLNNLTVVENLFLGRERLNSNLFIDEKTQIEECEKVLKRIKAPFGPNDLVRNLSLAKKQLVELAKALLEKAKIIIMDEPTTALEKEEIKNLFSLIRDLKEKGVGIIYISHRMEEIFEIGDRVTVLRDGIHIVTEDVAKLDQTSLIKYMVGRELKDQIPKTQVKRGPCLLEVKGLGKRNVLNPISFELHRGEILGISGLMGSGRTELAKIIIGAIQKDSGEIILEGKVLTINGPADAIQEKIVYVPEDRKEEGLILAGTVLDNMTLSLLSSIKSILGLIPNKRFINFTHEEILKKKIKCSGENQTIRNLSGGNQQKVVLSKWLGTDPRVLILDEPTRGIDVEAKSEIYKLLGELAQKGMGIILISSDLPEILGLSDRVLVLHERSMKGVLIGEKITSENIFSTALRTN